MAYLAELFSTPSVAVCLFSMIAILLYKAFYAKPRYPENTPWVGRDKDKWFSVVRANLASLNSGFDLLKEGYEKYSKKGKSYLIPDATNLPLFLLPRPQMQWVLDQSDDVLSSAAAHYDGLGEDYCFTHKNILRDAYHEHVIHKYLPRRLAAFIPDLQDEVAVGFDESWGTDTTEWKEIKLYESVMVMISHAVNRMIVGLPLCRNDDFLSANRGFAMAITGASLLIGHTPRWLKPVLGPLFALPCTMYYWRASKYTIPLITERKANFERKKKDPDFKWEPPNDFISWSIMLAEAENRPDESTIDMLSRRVMPIEFASIHTSSIAIAHCLLDLISSDPSDGYLDAIREESSHVLRENGGQWTKAGLAQCHLADSAMRESMRVSNFMSRNVIRKVMPSDGITHPTVKWHAPKGTYVGFDMHNVHHDPEIYLNPDNFDAFRFAPRTEAQSDGHAQETKKSGGNSDSPNNVLGNTGLVTTSETWFPFGRGKHTCPGRYLIAAEIKMLLAYMTMNYDVEPLKDRPEYLRMGTLQLPDANATIRVRRKVAKA